MKGHDGLTHLWVNSYGRLVEVESHYYILHFMCKDFTKCKTIQVGLFNVIGGISDACRKVCRKIISNVFVLSI